MSDRSTPQIMVEGAFIVGTAQHHGAATAKNTSGPWIGGPAMAMFGYRLLGAALLDDAMYEGIEADPSASWQAGATVTLSAAATGIGASGWRGPDPYGVVIVAALAVITWIAWATLMFHIGGRLMRTAE